MMAYIPGQEVIQEVTVLKRKIEDKLLTWKRTKTTQGLLVTGARQVGKTSSITDFARKHYEQVITIDFIRQPHAVDLITGATDLNDLIVRITSLAEAPLIQERGTGETGQAKGSEAPLIQEKGARETGQAEGHPENRAHQARTLLFFDEVQRCGDALTWMRYLGEDDRFDVIYSGSMLGVEAFDYRSLAVGTLDVLDMFPLDFEEFSWALGIDASLWGVVRECFTARTAVPDFLHERFIQAFYQYVFVGGMPEAVDTYTRTHDTQAMRVRQASILAAYRADISRHITGPEFAQQVKTVFEAVPAQLNKENRRFTISGTEGNSRFNHIRGIFDWLTKAGVVIPVTRATEASFPLGLSAQASFFKLYLSDVGLLFSALSHLDVATLLSNAAQMNLGMVMENAVAQELRAHGHHPLHYFNTKKVGEVDFLISPPISPTVVPVEVKSGGYSHTHAALDRLLDVQNYPIEQAIVLHTDNLETSSATPSSGTRSVVYLPIYMAGLL